MKFPVLLSILILISLQGVSQKGITFKIEELPKPDKLLYTQSYDAIYEYLIRSDADISPIDSLNFPTNIIAKSKGYAELVNYGYHSFFYGLYRAYAEHRPFVLSPDMIWLLISQGFAKHVNANPERLRHYFVNFDGQSTVVAISSNSLSNPNSKWEEIFPLFSKELAKQTKGELVDILSADFSTTTPVEKIASEITIMEAMKSYFEFIHIHIICGIPEITLEGTTEDWEKVLEKTRKLSQYDLEWWTTELEPILKEFIKASKGKINKPFWRKIFKYHTRGGCGAPTLIDGWIVKFFPYDNKGKRNNLQNLIHSVGKENLPEEIGKVGFKHIEPGPDGKDITTQLEIWAGFIGLEQNDDTYALTPKIGWMIRKKDIDQAGLQQKFESSRQDSWGISIRVSEIPETLLKLNKIKKLEIEFIDSIVIPKRLGEIEIDKLTLKGNISSEEIKRITGMFPKSTLIINKDTIPH